MKFKLEFKIIIALALFLILPLMVSATDWYVRPSGGDYGAEDGSDYDNALDGLESVAWGAGGVQPGDNLYICGLHLRTRTGGSAWQIFNPGVSGIDENTRITIRGDCSDNQGNLDQGIIWGSGIMDHEAWVDEGDGVYSITTVGTPTSNWYYEDITKDSWNVLTKTYTFDECKNTPGSFFSYNYSKGNKLYIHTSDDQDPTGRIAANRLGYHLQMNDKHYITWANLKFYSIYRWLSLKNNPPPVLTYMRWENCTIWYGEFLHFMFRNNCHHNEFINCDIAWASNGIGFAEYPIGSGSGPNGDGSEPHDNVIRGCKFHHIGVTYGTSDSHAISGQGSRNILIEDNEIYDTGTGITFYAYNTNQAIKNITIRYNWVHDTHNNFGANSRGIELNTGPGQAPGTFARVYGNIVGPNVSHDCYHYYWIELGEFYNNVAYDCGAASFYFHHHLYPVNVRVRNIISVNPGGFHIRYSNSNDSSVTSLDSDYNLFYPDNNNFFVYVPEARFSGVSFSEWQALSIPGSTFDTHSIAADPMFVDPDNGDFRLRPGSPAIDMGIDVGLTRDYYGNPVPQGNAPDIGAIESSFTAVFIEGDLNRDGSVDVADIIIVARNFGLTAGFEPNADTDSNNIIDIFDVVFVASRFT